MILLFGGAVRGAAQSTAYLVDGADLAVVDLDQRSLFDRIPLVAHITDLAVSADGAVAYAVGGRHLQVVDLRARLIRTLVPLIGEEPQDERVVLSPSGDRAYLYDVVDYEGDPEIAVLDTARGTFLPSIALPLPAAVWTALMLDLAISADGVRAYALVVLKENEPGYRLVVQELDLATGTLVRELPVTSRAQSFAADAVILPEESVAFVGSDRGLLTIDLASGAVLAEAPVPAWSRPYWDAARRRLYAWSWQTHGERETTTVYAVDQTRQRARHVARFSGWLRGVDLLPEGGAFIAGLSEPQPHTVVIAADSGAVLSEVATVAGDVVGLAPRPAGSLPVSLPRPSPTPAAPLTSQVLAVNGDGQLLSAIDSAAPAVARVVGNSALAGVRGSAAAPDGRRLYAITWQDLLILDPDNGAALQRVPVDQSVNGLSDVAVTLDGNDVWVAGDASLWAIDARDPRRQERIDLPDPPHALAFAADGRTLFVAAGHNSSSDPVGTLHVVDVAGRRLRSSIPIPSGATDVAVGGDGRVFVATGAGSVAVVDLASASVEAIVAVPSDATAIAASADGARVYVSGGATWNSVPPSLSVIDTATLRRTATLPVAAAGRIRDLLLTPDGQRALLSLDGGIARVVVVDLSRLEVVATLRASGDLAIGQAAWTPPPTATPLPRPTPASRRPCMLVPHGTSSDPSAGTITLIDPVEHAVAGSIRVGHLSPDTEYGEVYDGVVAVAPDPNGTRIYALVWPYAGGVGWLVAIDPRSRTEIGRLPLGAYPNGLAISRDGERALVAGNAGDLRTVTSVDLRAWRVLDEVALPGAPINGPYLSADGFRLFFRGQRFEASEPFSVLTALDADSLDVEFELPLPDGASPQGGIAVLPDGRTLLVDVGGEKTGRDQVAVIDLQAPSVAAVIEVPTTSWATRVWGSSAFAVAPDGGAVCRATGANPGVLTLFDPVARQVVAQIPDSQGVFGPAFTPDGTFVYAGSGWPAEIAVFDVAARRRVASIGVPAYPGGVVAAEIDGDCAPLAVPWTPTATPTPEEDEPAPTATARPTWSGAWQGVEVASISGVRGATLPVEVRLSADGAEVAGIEVRIAFAPPLAVAADEDGGPRCRVNPAIDKPGSDFVFHPVGCHDGACGAIKALVLSLSDVAPIADGAVLFTCDVTIAADAAPGVYPLRVTAVGASDPRGHPLPAIGRSGTVTVNAAPGHLSSRAGGSADACAVVAPGATGRTWWPIGAALVLIAMRGRRRRAVRCEP